LLVKVYPIHFIAEAYMINLAENFVGKDKGVCKAISPEALLMAAELRRELPARSAERIQQLLREKGYSRRPLNTGTAPAAAGLSGSEDQGPSKTSLQPSL